MNLSDCDKIYQAAWSTSDQDKFREYCQELFLEYPVIPIGARRGAIGFWRARKVDDGLDWWGNVDEMYAPPITNAFNRRLSNEGSPCFYASNYYQTTIHEIEAGVGDVVQFASFQITEFEQLLLMTIGEFANVFERGFMMLNGIGLEAYEAMGFDRMDSTKRSVVISIDKFFAHVLSDVKAREEAYMRTRTLTELLYVQQPYAHGIAYPSVRHPHGVNFGILPEVAKEKLQNVACFVRKVRGKHSYCMNDLESLHSCVDLTAAGDFVWVKATPGVMNTYNRTLQEVVRMQAEDKDRA